MKVFGIVLVVLLSSTMVYAQMSEHLGLYSDSNGSDCRVVETNPGLFQVFVIHDLTQGATASVFSVPVPSCASVSWLGDANDSNFMLGGFSPTGITVAYRTCRSAPIVVLRILYVGSVSQDCCRLRIEANTAPAEPPYPYEIDCEFVVHPVTVSPAYFNANVSCACIVPAQDTTWGRLKAVYGR